MNKSKQAKNNSPNTTKIKTENVPSTSNSCETSTNTVRKSARSNAGSNLYTRKNKIESENSEDVKNVNKSNKDSTKKLNKSHEHDKPVENLEVEKEVKKRGRPKRIPVPENAVSSNDAEIQIKKKIIVTSTPAIKRRKNVSFSGIDESFEPDGSIVETHHISTPKRRKKRVENLGESVHQATDNSDISLFNSCTSTNATISDSVVNEASTRCPTNIAKKSRKRRDRDSRIDVLTDTSDEQFYINDLLELKIQDEEEDTKTTVVRRKKVDINDLMELKIQDEEKDTKKKVVRRKKEKTDDELQEFDKEGQGESDISFDINFDFDLTEKGHRGRPPRSSNDDAALPIFYKMKDKPKQRGVCCIKCNVLIPEHNWLKHNCILHNNLSWREGETPVDFTNKEQVFRLWTQVLKQKLPLKCTKCNEKKLSVLGYYSHIKQCGKNALEIEKQKVTCQLCGSKILPISLKAHMFTNHGDKEKDIKYIDRENMIMNVEKRKAASKALNKFKDLDTDAETIIDQYDKQPRAQKIPAYYMTFWKTQLDECGEAHCLSPDCTLVSKDIDVLINHYEVCEHAPEMVYICKQCNFECAKQIDIVLHVKTTHLKRTNTNVKIKEERDDQDENFDFENELLNVDLVNKYILTAQNNYTPVKRHSATGQHSKKLCYKYVFLSQEREPDILDHSYTPVILWTKQFRELQYSNVLFSEYLPIQKQWTLVKLRDIDKYLPKTKKSIYTSRVPIGPKVTDVRLYNHEWKQYDLFDVDFNRNVITLYCGGPVRSMAWVPMPTSKDHNQYLSVVCKLDMDTFHKIGMSYSKPGLVQIWNCGVLNENSEFISKPYLAFGIAHDYGVVWDMQWCPSGCYQENERLGLLALACSDSNVYIISVPFPDQLNKINDQLPIFKTKPIFKLKLHDEDNSKLLGDTEYQVTKLSWNKLARHNIIAAGFSNGMVALWNLLTESPLLKEVQKDNTIVLYPYLCFQAHYAPVTVIDFANFDEVRWLFTGSYDQMTRFWDLNDIKYPFTEHKRGIITDGFWWPHWNSGLACCDDVLMQSATVTSIIASRDFGYKPVPIFRTNSCCNCVTANEWLNGLAQGSVAGEWQMTFPTQILCGLEYEKNLRTKRVLGGYTEWIDRTKTSEQLVAHDAKKVQLAKKDLQEYSKLSDTDLEILPCLYSDAAEKYGVVFCDFNLRDRRTMPQMAYEKIHCAESLKEFPNDMYPIVSMNKMCWNPNEHSYRYIAIGYQVGFVRLHCVNFIKVRR